MNKEKVLAITMMLIFTFLSTYSSYAQDGRYEQHTISVSGRGEVSITPDLANISFSVETMASTASDAVKENAEKTSKVLKTLKTQIGKDDKMSTAGYNLSPVYEYNNQTKKSEFNGYRATNVIMVKTYNLNNLGNLIDSAATAGSNNIQGLSFDTTKRDKYRREALVEAVVDAKTTADTVTNAAGVQITKILRISPSYDYPIPVYRDFSPSTIAPPPPPSPATPIEAGEISINASVNMVFGIE